MITKKRQNEWRILTKLSNREWDFGNIPLPPNTYLFHVRTMYLSTKQSIRCALLSSNNDVCWQRHVNLSSLFLYCLKSCKNTHTQFPGKEKTNPTLQYGNVRYALIYQKKLFDSSLMKKIFQQSCCSSSIKS